MNARSALSGAPQTPAKESTQNSTSAKQIHLHLARMAGVDVDLILGDLAQMGWTITDDDVEIISEFARSRRIGTVR